KLPAQSPMLPHRFFYHPRDGTPRHLHSFPTRRSSDLSPRLIGKIPSALSNPTRTSVDDRSSKRVRSAAAPSSTARPQGRMSPTRDRKSTRLNSSHDQISYAVFCLKKKNEFFFFA